MATEYTPNYNLDLYASADKPNLCDQYNAAMGKIDTQMKKSADDVTNANANVLTLQTQMTEAQKDIAELESTVDEHGRESTDRSRKHRQHLWSGFVYELRAFEGCGQRRGCCVHWHCGIAEDGRRPD